MIIKRYLLYRKKQYTYIMTYDFTTMPSVYDCGEIIPEDMEKEEIGLGVVPDEKCEVFPTPYEDVIFAGGGEKPVEPKTCEFIVDGNWEDAANWLNGAKPISIDTVIIRANCTINSVVSADAVEIVAETGCTLQVAPEGGLIVGKGGISGATVDNFILRAATEGEIKGQTGFLKISPEYTGEIPYATVELFSIAHAVDNNYFWQYVGIPVETSALAKTFFQRCWVYNWDEATGNWKNTLSKLVMRTFEGYATTQDRIREGFLVTFTGNLHFTNNATIVELSFTDDEHGQNFVANSFTAPIDMTKLCPSDFINARPVLLFLNTIDQTEFSIQITTPEDIKRQCQEAGISNIIPSMQGFGVKATGENAQLILDYDRLVWNGDNINAPLL